MPNIIYEYADGQKILIKGEEKSNYATRGGSTDAATVTKKVATRFEDALQCIKPTLIALKNVLDEAKPDEVEVEFSLKAEGEAGLFSICSTAIGAEFKIKAVWKK
jgi:hypothetical protein